MNTPTIEELAKRQAQDDPVFAAWRDSVPDKHWVKLDLSALRIGYELGRALAEGSASSPPHWMPLPEPPKK